MSSNLAELRRQAKLPAKQAGGAVVSQFFEANRATISAVLPKHMTPERIMKLALGAIRATPKLMECTTESLFGAVVLASQLGLEPNTPLGHCYLIPFKNGKITEVQFIPGFKGLIDLARRSGHIKSISAHAVYSGDEFEFEYGLNERLSHRPSIAGDRGHIIAFYAVAQFKDGGHQFEVMSKAEVDAIMRRTPSRGEYGPWKDYYKEMGRKTAVRRLAKYLPMSIEVASAIHLDNLADTGEPQGLDRVLAGEWSVESPAEDAPPAGMDPETGEVKAGEPA